MKNASLQCVEFLNYLQDRIVDQMDDPEIRENLQNVIQHEKNMIKFFGVLEQKL
jgi:hypothetical protein